MDHRSRLRYNHIGYIIWFVLAGLSGIAAIWTAWAGEWGWALGWAVGALALAAHARLERFDGHIHRNGVEVP